MSPEFQGLIRLVSRQPRPWSEASLTEIVGAADRLRARDLAPLIHPGAFPDGSWGCRHLVQAPQLGLSAFFLKAGRSMPLHDHPGMQVALKVVYGRARLAAYDWHTAPGARGWARRLYVAELDGASPCSVVRPGFGNIHGLEALEDCVFLDLYSPRYDPEGGRPCRYYAIAERCRDGDDVHARLIEASDQG